MDSTYTIIIADDHPLFRNALFQSVHMAISGANLLEADSLDALLTLLNKESEPDLLLLDLKMPGANGMSGLIHLRSEYPDLPIVVISASEEPSVVSGEKSRRIWLYSKIERYAQPDCRAQSSAQRRALFPRTFTG
ncbi:transcriptional regulator, LuxR family [Vibrio cholerae]|nr:transcriptional regulator, LuxR family [Vibrio cholerae]